MTQVLYKADKSNLASYGNVTAILLWQHAGSMRPTVLLMTVFSYLTVFEQFDFARGIMSTIKHNILPTR